MDAQTSKYYYSIDDLHASVNDLYQQYDNGSITKQDAVKVLVACAKEFLKSNQGE